MEPAFRVLTYRDGQHIITETLATEHAAWARFESAVEMCRTRDDAHAHRVELYEGPDMLDGWSATTT